MLLAELNRRRVFRALIGYGIAAFAVLQYERELTDVFAVQDEIAKPS